MLLVYLSLTGNTKRFVEKLEGYDSLEITPTNPFIKIKQPYVVIAPTYEIEATESLNDFIEHNDIKFLKGIIGGGNRNFADLFIYTAKDLASKYNSQVLYAFEYSGTPIDVLEVESIVDKLKEEVAD